VQKEGEKKEGKEKKRKKSEKYTELPRIIHSSSSYTTL
jgi:hypothetical protein